MYSGFLGVKGVNVVILYPSGKVSDVQEKQLTTSITRLEVDGTLTTAKPWLKAFLDTELTDVMNLLCKLHQHCTLVASNVLLLFGYKQLKDKIKKLVFSVPSGNFGNICAGMMAQKLGLPIEHFYGYKRE